VSAVALTELPSCQWNLSDRWNRLAARLREDRGVGLIELLIALLVLNIGIFATFAAFTSGAVALRHASHVSTATALADKTMEALHDSSYDAIVNSPATNTTGADGRTYTVQVQVTEQSESTGGSGKVKKAIVTITDPRDSTVHVNSTSTFSLCTQAALSSNSNPCQS
jgi:Tfp pilus assembly protein PilE